MPRPDAGVPRVALGRYSERVERPDEGFLDAAQIPVQVPAVTFEIEDGIAHELTGAVEGNVTPPLHLE